MVRIFVYLLLVGCFLYFFWAIRNNQMGTLPGKNDSGTPSRRFRPKRNPGETWIQVYETETLKEGQMIQARLQEEEVECILYEQGKKDLQGNPLKGIGIAVPKSSATLAQSVISRMPA